MTEQLHPTLYEIVPSVAFIVARRFDRWVDREDVRQECYLWAVSRNKAFEELLNEPNDEKRVQNEKRIGYQMKRVAVRYCRKEKASKSGYATQDEAYYETHTIAQLLPFVISAIINDTVLEQSQVMVNDGQPKKPSVPAESGNLLATLIDIKNSYIKLSPDEKKILEQRYLDSFTLQQLAQYWECAVSTADRRCDNALRALQDGLGGETPYQ